MSEPTSPLNPLQMEIVRRRAEGQRPVHIHEDLRVSQEWVHRTLGSDAGKAEMIRLTQIREDAMTEGWRQISELDGQAIKVVEGCLKQAQSNIDAGKAVTPAQIHAAEKHLDRRGYKADDQPMSKQGFADIVAVIEAIKARHKASLLEQEKRSEIENGTSNVGKMADLGLVTEESHE